MGGAHKHPSISIRPDAELRGRVERYAARERLSRAEAILELLAAGLEAADLFEAERRARRRARGSFASGVVPVAAGAEPAAGALADVSPRQPAWLGRAFEQNPLTASGALPPQPFTPLERLEVPDWPPPEPED